jgi:uncharacterized protein (DUF3820 family)
MTNMMEPLTLPAMPFGRFKGEPLTNVSRPYLSFILSFPNLDDDLREAVRQELRGRGLGFGKFKGVALSEVPDSYLRWLLDSNFLVPPWDELSKDELERRNVCEKGGNR